MMIAHDAMYVIRPSFLKFIKMKLVVGQGKKAKTTISLFGKARKMKTVRQREDCIELQFNIGIVMIDMVCIFHEAGKLSGFFDTPVGNLKFTGYIQ